MDFAGGDRQRPGTMKDAYRFWQLIVGAQISMELPAVRLFDDQNAVNAVEGCGQTFRRPRSLVRYAGNDARYSGRVYCTRECFHAASRAAR